MNGEFDAGHDEKSEQECFGGSRTTAASNQRKEHKRESEGRVIRGGEKKKGGQVEKEKVREKEKRGRKGKEGEMEEGRERESWTGRKEGETLREK